MTKLEFGSILFLFFFFPIFFCIYYVVPNKWKNKVLFIGSIFFIICGRENLIWYFLIATFLAYFGMRLLWNLPKSISKKKMVCCIIGLEMIVWFSFICSFHEKKWIYPICYSIILLENIGSLLDFYIKKEKIPDIFSYFTYAACFPKLVIGPVISYFDMKEELENRAFTIESFSNGMLSFSKGLVTLILIVYPLSNLRVSLLEIPISVFSSWYLLFVITLEVCLFMKSYSNMAIGLGRMLGFSWRAETSYPLALSKLQYFFQNWHASIDAWWKRYFSILKLKIPMVFQFFLFVILLSFTYGIHSSFFFLMIGLGIMIEEKIRDRSEKQVPKVFSYLIHFLWIFIASLFFIPNQLIQKFFFGLFDFIHYPIVTRECSYLFYTHFWILLFALLIGIKIGFQIEQKMHQKRWFIWAQNIGLFVLFVIAVIMLITGIEHSSFVFKI